MTASLIFFYLIAAFILGAGILAVTTKQLFRSAIWLLLSLVGIAALYFLLEVNFLAAVQIIVYVGGIVVLIIFSIFLTHTANEALPPVSLKKQLTALLAAVIGFGFFYRQLYKMFCYNIVSDKTFTPAVAKIGTQMLNTKANGFALPFEVVSMLLLAALIGCIVIALKIKPTDQ